MTDAAEVLRQINRATTYLLELGVSSDQNVAIERRSGGGHVQVCYPNIDALPPMAGRTDYAETYSMVASGRAFHVRLLDGALIQMDYRFVRRNLQYHRLTWFPAPHLEDFLGSPDVYLTDDPFGDIVGREIVAFPVRFDYDHRHVTTSRNDHPGSHLTLGQYDGCRIPVSRPVTPFWFMDFILRNFYLPSLPDAPALPSSENSFAECISDVHRGAIHVAIPSRPLGTPRRPHLFRRRA